MKTAAVAIALTLAVSTITTPAQTSGGFASTGGGSGGALGHGQGGQHQRPSPAQIAAHMMQKFDANKDGKLELGELTQALEALRNHRRQGAGSAAAGGRHGLTGSGQQARPSADKIAAHMIEKYAADKKGLTQAELTQALAAHRAQHGQHGGGVAGHTSSGTAI
jgi:hypothetical protein